MYVISTCLSRDSVVGTTTRYDINGTRIEFRWGRGFLHLSRPTQPHVQRVPVLFPAGKGSGAWRWPPTLIYWRR